MSHNNSLSSSQTLPVDGSGNFSGEIDAGSANSSSAYFKMKAKVTGQAYGTETNSYTIGAGYITINNKSAALTSTSITYATNMTGVMAAAGKKDASWNTTITETHNPLYTYSTVNSDLSVNSATTYASSKTFSHNLAYDKWHDDTDGNNVKLQIYNQDNGLESTFNENIHLEIPANLTISYPGSQICIGKSQPITITGDAGASTNVTKVKFSIANHSDSVHYDPNDGNVEDTLSSGS